MTQGRKQGPATRQQMQELHAALVREVARTIQAGEATAKHLEVAAALLRDSRIEARGDIDVRRLRRLHSHLLDALLRQVPDKDAPPAVLAVAERLLARHRVTTGAAPKSDAERQEDLRKLIAMVPFRVQ